MAQSIGIILRRAPYGAIHAAEAIRHTIGAVTEIKATIILMGDGVYAAQENQRAEGTGWTSLSEALKQALALSQAVRGKTDRGIAVYAYQGALADRGLAAEGLVPGVQVIGDAELARLVAAMDAAMVY